MRNIFKKLSFIALPIILTLLPILGIQQTKAASDNGDYSIVKITFADEKTDSLDLAARKNILITISDTAKTDIDALKEKLDGFDLNADWVTIRTKFTDDLSDFSSYYKSFEDRVGDESITLNDIKGMAKDLRDWREKNYTPELKEITNMILIFQDENLLQTAHGRLDKISSDIKKMDKQNIIKTDALKVYFTQADKKLRGAEDSKNDAKDLFFKTMTDFFEISTSTEATSTTANTEPAKKITQKEVSDIQDSIRDLLASSIKDIKATYDIFFQMNSKMKKALQ